MSTYPPDYNPDYAPAPPPPPAGGSGQTFNFGRAFTYVFEDPDWVKKIIIGGLFQLASMFLIGIPFVLGYFARTMRNVMNGVQRPLPEWDDFGGFFGEGLKLFVVGFLYFLPLAILYFGSFVGAAILGSQHSDAGQILGCGMGGLMCVVFVLVFVVAILLPAATTLVVADGSIASGFAFGRILGYVRANAANYLLAFLAHFLANFLSQFGMILLCVGVFFTGFWSLLVAAYAYGDAYRLSPVR
jgi:Protein of unknown function (DUF4013)